VQNNDLEKYSSACEEIGTNMKLKPLNLFKDYTKKGDYKNMLQSDAIHISPMGYRALADTLLKMLPPIKPLLPAANKPAFWRELEMYLKE